MIAGEARVFGVSGKLWNGVLVMYDEETDSLWTQIDGRAIRGASGGTKLEYVESTFTTWKEWLRAHPDTQVLARDPEAEPLEGSRYAAYLDDPDRLFLPELGEGIGGVAPKDLVFGVTVAGEAWAVTESVLRRDELVQTVVAGSLVGVVIDPSSGATRAFLTDRDGELRLLQPVPGRRPFDELRDASSGETVRPADLPSLRLDRAYWYAWARSHPGSRVLADGPGPAPAVVDPGRGQ